jgi:lipoprotein-releasing system ATP-binding protein
MSNPDPTSSAPLLDARRLHRTYVLGQRSVEVLCGVDLQVNLGDFIALRGASGAGKSTLLHLLGGLDVPNAGEVWLQGRNLAHLSEVELAEVRNRRVGYIFQAYHLLPELDALENVCLPGRISRRPTAEVEREGRALLERVGLAQRLDHRPYELSGGEQQRVAIARALINHPALVLADEPTGNLDSHAGSEILDLLCDLRAERQAALLIATHDTRVAARAPRILEMADGQLVDGMS